MPGYVYGQHPIAARNVELAKQLEASNKRLETALKEAQRLHAEYLALPRQEPLYGGRTGLLMAVKESEDWDKRHPSKTRKDWPHAPNRTE